METARSTHTRAWWNYFNC